MLKYTQYIIHRLMLACTAAVQLKCAYYIDIQRVCYDHPQISFRAQMRLVNVWGCFTPCKIPHLMPSVVASPWQRLLCRGRLTFPGSVL